MIASGLSSRPLCHHPCMVSHPSAAKSVRLTRKTLRCHSGSPSTPDLLPRDAQPGSESNAKASGTAASAPAPGPLGAPFSSPSFFSCGSPSFFSCGNLGEMIAWFQQHGLSQRELQPGLVAPVAQKVVDLWEEAVAEDQPTAVAHLAEIAPMAIAFSLQNSTGLKARAAVQCTIALGKLPAVDPTVVLSLVEPAAGVRQGLSTVPPAELVSMLEVLAGTRVRPGNALLGAIMSELGAGMGQLSGPALASLLWALVVLGVKPTATWLEAHEAACRATLQELGPQHLGRLAWASGRLGLSPGPAWLAGFCGASSHALAHARWDGSQLCGFMEGCAALPALGAVATQLWRQELLKVSGTLLPSLREPDLVSVLRAVSELQLHPGPQWLCAAWERAFALLLPVRGDSATNNSSKNGSSSSSSSSSSRSVSSSSSSSSSSRSVSSSSGGVRGGAGVGGTAVDGTPNGHPISHVTGTPNRTATAPNKTAGVGGAAVDGTTGAPSAPVTGSAFSSRDLADLLPLLLQLSRPTNLDLGTPGPSKDLSKDSAGGAQRRVQREKRRQPGASASLRGGGEKGSNLISSSSSRSSSASSVRAAVGVNIEGFEVGGQSERLPVALVGRRPKKEIIVSSAGSSRHGSVNVPGSMNVPGFEQGQPSDTLTATQDAMAHQQHVSHEREVMRHPSAAWMAAYLSNVFHALPRMPAEALPKVLQVVAGVGASPQPGWLDAYAAALTGKAAVLPSPSLTSAALLLLQLASLQPRPLVHAPTNYKETHGKSGSCPAGSGTQPPSSALASTSQPSPTQPHTPQSHIPSPEPTMPPSEGEPGRAVDNSLASDPVLASAGGDLLSSNTAASVEKAGRHSEKVDTHSILEAVPLDEGPGYRSHRGANSSIATVEGSAAISPPMSSVLCTLWAQVGGPNASSLSDEHLVESIQVLASCGISCDRPLQEKVALNALQPRLVRLPRLQLIGLGEAVLKLQMQPDNKWWSAYVHRLQQCLEERTPMPPAACSALLWTIVTAGLYIKPRLLRLLSMHIRAAVEGGIVKEDVSHRRKRLTHQRAQSRSAKGKCPAPLPSPKRSKGKRPAHSVKGHPS